MFSENELKHCVFRRLKLSIGSHSTLFGNVNLILRRTIQFSTNPKDICQIGVTEAYKWAIPTVLARRGVKSLCHHGPVFTNKLSSPAKPGSHEISVSDPLIPIENLVKLFEEIHTEARAKFERDESTMFHLLWCKGSLALDNHLAELMQ